jgi:signal recognition particle receptor subunit beta
MPDVVARILLWGIEGAGKTATLNIIHSKLRPELRGEILQEPTRLDSTLFYESLAIRLGEVDGAAMQIEIIAVPGAPDQAMTRKQLLDEVDGVVIVLDASPKRIDSNYAAIDELRASLAAYGRRLEAFPIVLQYNKRDIADPFAIEALHRRIGLQQAAVFETIATTGHGILATLTTISKHVVRAHRTDDGQTASGLTTPVADTPEAVPAELVVEHDEQGSAPHEILEAAILAESAGDEVDALAELVELESEPGRQPDWNAVESSANKPDAGLGAHLKIVSVGQAALDTEGAVQLPLVLGDDDGQTRTVVLSLRLDELLPGGND